MQTGFTDNATSYSVLLVFLWDKAAGAWSSPLIFASKFPGMRRSLCPLHVSVTWIRVALNKQKINAFTLYMWNSDTFLESTSFNPTAQRVSPYVRPHPPLYYHRLEFQFGSGNCPKSVYNHSSFQSRCPSRSRHNWHLFKDSLMWNVHKR
jgi:hypothetical protein